MERKRYIVHVDMDAFFAAVEQRNNPLLRGKPVIIGADPKGGRGRGVVSTCSYEARKFGVHSAMPISIAYKKCPHAVYLPVDMEKYARVSAQVYDVLSNFTPIIEPVSIDEAFLDITGSYHIFGTPQNACKLIKSRIKEKTHLSVSVGLAPTKMAAKIASDLQKPDGFVEVAQDGLLDFLWPLPVERIWGLGKKTTAVLNERGLKTVGDLAKRKREELVALLGKSGEYFHQLAWGIDEAEVETEEETKSVSNETTFEQDTSDKNQIEGALLALCEKVSGRLRHEKLKGRTITLKIRLQGFHTYTRAITFSRATNFADMIYKAIKKLYEGFDAKGKGVRLVGVKISNLISADLQDSIFKDKIDDKKEYLHRVVDKIKDKFGERAIYRAGSTHDKI
ncbi:MAG: DNA polymerase IV [Candidatus Omnitrophota bacterium]|nr:MAG: DNA polymerase IV [Candidatus Omnitrophota bacterium]